MKVATLSCWVFDISELFDAWSSKVFGSPRTVEPFFQPQNFDLKIRIGDRFQVVKKRLMYIPFTCGMLLSKILVWTGFRYHSFEIENFSSVVKAITCYKSRNVRCNHFGRVEEYSIGCQNFVFP